MSSSRSHHSPRYESHKTNDDASHSFGSPTIFTILPQLHSKFSKIRALRRTLSQSGGTSRHERFPSSDSTDSLTPPPSYQTDAEALDRAEEEANLLSLQADIPPSRPSSSGSATPLYAMEVDSGVHWRRANTALSLLSLAKEEASESLSDPNLIRTKYVGGVACAIQGLPADLTPDELRILSAALPASLVLEPRDSASQITTRPRSSAQRRDQHPNPAVRQSTLHCCVAFVTVHIFLAIAFLIPYVQYLLQQAYQFDRKHKLSDRALAQSMAMADAMSRRTIALASQVCAMNEGKVGESLREAGVYLVQGFSSGVYDGVGDGMQRYGLRTSEDFRSKSVEATRQRERPRPRSSPVF